MYNLYNEDFLEYIKKINNNSIDLIVTDPPYKTTKRGNSGNAGGMCRNKLFSKGVVFNTPVTFFNFLLQIGHFSFSIP